MKPGKYVVRVYSNSEHFNPASCAVLSLSQELMDTLEARWKLFVDIHKKNGSLDQMVYNDSDIAFYEDTLAVEEFFTSSAQQSQYENDEWVSLKRDLPAESVMSSDCDHMVIDENYVHWACYPQYTDGIICTTVLLPFKELFKEKL